MKDALIVVFAIAQFALGIALLFRTNEIIHVLFSPYKGYQRFDKLLPRRSRHFLDLIENDPETLSTDFPIATGIVKAMGVAALIISIATFCGVFAQRL